MSWWGWQLTTRSHRGEVEHNIRPSAQQAGLPVSIQLPFITTLTKVHHSLSLPLHVPCRTVGSQFDHTRCKHQSEEEPANQPETGTIMGPSLGPTGQSTTHEDTNHPQQRLWISYKKKHNLICINYFYPTTMTTNFREKRCLYSERKLVTINYLPQFSLLTTPSKTGN